MLKNKKLLSLIAIVLALALVTMTLLLKDNHEESGVAPTFVDGINMSPATDQEKQDVIDNKQRIVDEKKDITKAQNTTDGKNQVKPQINFVELNNGNIELGSYVPGIFEDNGECVALFVKDNNSLTKSVMAVKEGANVYCPLIVLPRADFTSSGEWEVTVEYNSEFSFGKSDSRKIVVK